MTNAPPTEPAADPALVCMQCGYTLDGLAEDGVCPECATPVARSITARNVRFPSPQRLRAALIGVTVLRVGTVAIPIGVVATMLFVLVSALSGFVSGSNIMSLLIGAIIVAWACWPLGWALVARRDPTIPNDAQLPTSNRTQILCSAATLAIVIGLLILSAISSAGAATGPAPVAGPPTSSGLMGALTSAAFWLLSMLFAAQAWAGAAIISRMLGPLPPPRRKTGDIHPHWLRKSARLFLILQLVILAINAALFATGRAAYIGLSRGGRTSGQRDDLGEALSAITTFLSLGAFLFGLSVLAQSIILLGRVRRELRQAIDDQRAKSALADAASAEAAQ